MNTGIIKVVSIQAQELQVRSVLIILKETNKQTINFLRNE